MMSWLKRHRTPVVLVVGMAQLIYLMTLPATREAITMLARAIGSGHYTRCVLLAPFLLGCGIVLNERLKRLNWRWLEWSPFHVKANLALVPLEARWLWAPYAALLAACMPILAFFEEVIFRSGTTSWMEGILWGSLAFGLFHLVSFVSVRMVLYLSLVGAVLVQVYMLDGLLAVFVVHAVYNLLALGLLVVQGHAKGRTAQRLRAGVMAAASRSLAAALDLAAPAR